jgi:hypothetical protein
MACTLITTQKTKPIKNTDTDPSKCQPNKDPQPFLIKGRAGGFSRISRHSRYPGCYTLADWETSCSFPSTTQISCRCSLAVTTRKPNFLSANFAALWSPASHRCLFRDAGPERKSDDHPFSYWQGAASSKSPGDMPQNSKQRHDAPGRTVHCSGDNNACAAVFPVFSTWKLILQRGVL